MTEELQQRAADLIDTTFPARYLKAQAALQEVLKQDDLNRETKVLVLTCLTGHLFKCAVVLDDTVGMSRYLSEWLQHIYSWYRDIESNEDVVATVISLFAQYAAEFRVNNTSKD